MSVDVRVNDIGLERNEYTGSPSTLCKGCGHNSIANQIISVAYELSINPHRVVKLSGIGCSSKSPAYFLGRSHGFNGLHGRMPSIATGVTTVNRDLIAIGVSGDGDTGSIGLGQFARSAATSRWSHRREQRRLRADEGQFSATADQGQVLKYAGVNDPPIDICLEALAAEATFVARSFAGDPAQVRELLGRRWCNGTAVLDIISPCVTFNNHETSTKSYPWGKQHEEALQDITYVPYAEPIMVDYDEGEVQIVELHDGSRIQLKKLDPASHDPTDRRAAMELLEQARENMEFPTGLIYYDGSRQPFAEVSGLIDTPLTHLPEDRLRPPREALDRVLAKLTCC